MAANKTIKPANILAANAKRGELAALKIPEFLDALETLGIIQRAIHAVGVDHRVVAQWMVKDPDLANRIKAAQEKGRARRIDYLEAKLYDHVEGGNLTAVIFALKREDPSYRESYNVSTSTQPTNYVIDLGLPDDPTPIADITPANVLE
jgi:hypothetical protein